MPEKAYTSIGKPHANPTIGLQCETAGSAAPPAASCKNRRRGSFIMSSPNSRVVHTDVMEYPRQTAGVRLWQVEDMYGQAKGDSILFKHRAGYCYRSFLAKLESLKADVVTLLSQCESAGKSEKDALVTFDPDKSGKARNIPSFGILQFKVPTGA